jgi:glycosyltransferase involved in cell wall biosynthesis
VTSSIPRISTGHERDLGLPPIENPYLLVSRIPFLRDGEGRLFTNRLWFHDLKEHLAYLTNFTIACPVIDQAPPEGFVPLESEGVLARLRVVPLPGAQTLPQAAASMPTTLVKVWHADDANILSDEQAKESWNEKHAAGPELKVLFVGQLKPAKGVLVLLEAIRRLGAANVPVELHILGAGELVSPCESAANELRGAARIRMLGTVPYGPEFFRLLRQYHAVVVPGISDEQPRIVYDAFSQAVPVLATRTPGLIDCVQNGHTGWLVEPNDSGALSALIARAATESDALQTMGLEALTIARRVTHHGMHGTRHRLLAAMMADL